VVAVAWAELAAGAIIGVVVGFVLAVWIAARAIDWPRPPGSDH
jgi:hypothetical protein